MTVAGAGAGRTRRLLLATAAAALLSVPLMARAAAIGVTSQHLTTVSTCALVASPGSALIDADSQVQQALATTTAGSAATMSVATAAAANVRAYVRFDISRCLTPVPAQAVVRTATLRLYATVISATCETVDVFAAPSSWTESAVDWQNQPEGTTLNTPAQSQRTSSVSIGLPGACANHTAGAYVGLDVTADVAGFAAGTATNNGWMLRDDAEGSTTPAAQTFTTQDAGVQGQAPQLVVSYTLL